MARERLFLSLCSTSPELRDSGGRFSVTKLCAPDLKWSAAFVQVLSTCTAEVVSSAIAEVDLWGTFLLEDGNRYFVFGLRVATLVHTIFVSYCSTPRVACTVLYTCPPRLYLSSRRWSRSSLGRLQRAPSPWQVITLASRNLSTECAIGSNPLEAAGRSACVCVSIVVRSSFMILFVLDIYRACS